MRTVGRSGGHDGGRLVERHDGRKAEEHLTAAATAQCRPGSDSYPAAAAATATAAAAHSYLVPVTSPAVPENLITGNDVCRAARHTDGGGGVGGEGGRQLERRVTGGGKRVRRYYTMRSQSRRRRRRRCLRSRSDARRVATGSREHI